MWNIVNGIESKPLLISLFGFFSSHTWGVLLLPHPEDTPRCSRNPRTMHWKGDQTSQAHWRMVSKSKGLSDHPLVSPKLGLSSGILKPKTINYYRKSKRKRRDFKSKSWQWLSLSQLPKQPSPAPGRAIAAVPIISLLHNHRDILTQSHPLFKRI